MKKLILIVFACFATSFLFSQVVEETFHFSDYQLSQTGCYHLLTFPGTQSSGLPGEPVLPYQAVALILPPGEKATSIEVIREMEQDIPGSFILFPQQHVRPLSEGVSGSFIQDKDTYRQDRDYPLNPAGHLTTQYLNGFAIALSSFTPIRYNPARGTLSYYRKVTVRVHSAPNPQAIRAMENHSSSATTTRHLHSLAQNPEAAEDYPVRVPLKTNYQILLITSQSFSDSFQALIDHYQNHGMTSQVVITQTISTTMPGQDLQEQIRNFIIQEYQTNGVEFVLLGGDAELVPYRGFYCQVQSSSIYEDSNIPSDLYYSALDGTWNNNGNNLWGEPGEDDLLPEVAVTRYPFSTETELQNMIQKSISYQVDPVLGELQQPLMVGEHLWDNPLTFGGDFMDLLIDDQTANGYFTHGIPSAENTIVKLYDTLISPGYIFYWDPGTLLNEINLGKSFIHHLGHSNSMYMMRLYIWDITNQNFSQVNGEDHNYTLLYTQGCLCGAFDEDDCIAEKAVTIENFLAGGVFNSRYGWFNEGQTEGPSEHLHREFVSALYNDTISYKRIGETQMISKIKTAPWVTAPGQWEPGALRWCFYCCNVFGDPAMEIWTDEPPVGVPEVQAETSMRLYPNPASDRMLVSVEGPLAVDAEITLSNTLGQVVLRSRFNDRQGATNRCQLDLTGLISGIYLVSIETVSGVKTSKLIIH
ncbi:MAG: C25 family cysteine peptidase [Bacteroidota bacterium]